MKYHGVVISDIHIGAFPIEKLYQEFKYQFLEKVKKMKELDFIIFCGDLFDHKLFLNEKESYYAYKMIQELISICKKDIKIRFVYGTESHECNQYNIFSTIKDTDIRIIKTVEEEELFPDCRVLYLPEEYVYDKKEFYKDYFEKEDYYDFIFGHGIIREGMKVAAVKNENSSKTRKKVPVFSTAEFHKICKGRTFFGHYHIHTKMDDVFYVGSFSRWKFGEEEEKGFYEIFYNTEKEIHKEIFIKNELAEIYHTINYGYENQVFQNMDILENKLSHIEKVVESDSIDHIKFQFNLPVEVENPEFIMRYIQNRFKFHDNIKVDFTNGYVKEKKKKESEEIKKENDKYGFIFNKDMKFENKTAYFIQIEYNKDIPVERVSMYLYQPLNEILAKEED